MLWIYMANESKKNMVGSKTDGVKSKKNIYTGRNLNSYY